MIDLQAVSVAFEPRNKAGAPVQAVRDATLAVEKGEVFGIVGSSGAGKSTLVRAINLLERPASGRVVVNGTTSPASGPRSSAASARRSA